MQTLNKLYICTCTQANPCIWSYETCVALLRVYTTDFSVYTHIVYA